MQTTKQNQSLNQKSVSAIPFPDKMPNDTEERIFQTLYNKYPDYIKWYVDKKEWTYNHYHGACDVCGNCDGVFNVRSNNYQYCTKHKRVWLLGSNVMESWRHENEQIWEKNKKKFGKYKNITGFEYYDKLYPEVKDNDLPF